MTETAQAAGGTVETKVLPAATPENKPKTDNLNLAPKKEQGTQGALFEDVKAQETKPETAPPPPKPETTAATPDQAAKKPEGPTPEIISGMRQDFTDLNKAHSDLLESVKQARQDKCVQLIRAAGVEGLADAEILQLVPDVNPDTNEGRQKINAWIESHPGLVAPKYKMQGPKPEDLAKSAIENRAVKTIFGSEQNVRSRIKDIFGGE